MLLAWRMRLGGLDVAQALMLDTFTDVGGIIILGVGGMQVLHGDMVIEELVTFYAFYNNINKLVLSLANSATTLQVRKRMYTFRDFGAPLPALWWGSRCWSIRQQT